METVESLTGVRLGRYKKISKTLSTLELKSAVKYVAVRFQLMRRLQESDDYGFCVCITSGKRIHFKQIDAGHYMSRRHHSTVFMSDNCWPQSKKNNYHDSGDPVAYRMSLNKKIGQSRVQQIEKTAHQVQKQFTKEELALLCLSFNDEILKHQKRLRSNEVSA